MFDRRLHSTVVEALYRLKKYFPDVKVRFKYNSSVPIAACVFDTRSSEYVILINPSSAAMFPPEELALIFAHELLHFFRYDGLEVCEPYVNPILLNIALDAAINRVLYSLDPYSALSLFRRLYGSVPTDAFAILTPEPEPSKPRHPDWVIELWKYVWKSEEPPSPAAIYYALVKHIKVPLS